MLLRRFYDEALAQASYMLGCQTAGEAVVVDPRRDPDLYLAAAKEEGLRIAFVTETHIHADFLSGSRELAKRSGARLLLSGYGGAAWAYRYWEADGGTLRDGDRFSVGTVELEVLHTPGHTPEHVSFLVSDRGVSAGAAGNREGSDAPVPMALLSGDFVFVGDVGRPDLLERAAGETGTMEDGARQLYASLGRFKALPSHVQVLPGHGSGSACGKALGAVPSSTVGYELLVNWAFQCATEDDFVAKVLADQPEPPAYFARMKRLNRDGPPMLPETDIPEIGADLLPEMRVRGCTLLDARERAAYAKRHLPGSINVPLARSFPTWCGWLVSPARPVVLIADVRTDLAKATGGLHSVGIDDLVGWVNAGDSGGARNRNAAAGTAGPDGDWSGCLAVVDWGAAEKAREEENAVLIDVRSLGEWEEGRVPGARRIHLGELRSRARELPGDRPVLLHCRTGHRSAIGCSVLRAEGHADARNVEGGWEDRLERGMPVLGRT